MDSFLQATPLIACGSQPSADEIQQLAEQGYQAVINLGLHNTDYALENEASLVSGHGMQYHHLPIPFEQPETNHFECFYDLMQQYQAEKCFVHCAANKRATVFIALYGQKVLHWTPEEANTFIHKRWQPNCIWQTFLDDVRSNLN